MSRKKKILLVDDHPVMLEGLSKLIAENEGLAVCGTAEDEAGVIDAISEHRPDAIIMDIGLKNSNGLNIMKSLHAQKSTIPILVLSMHDEALYAERCLKAGALGYLMKQEAPDKVIEALFRVLSGSIYVSEKIIDRIVQRTTTNRDANVRGITECLTDRELEVFELIGTGHGTRDIAEKLNLSVKTVETYRERIKVKLGFKTGTQLVQQAHSWVQDAQ
ncbi:MAG: response regulator transcription factor [Candidatus Omnitrophota bacterium]|nr:response regulator transcription factor [Candidatus Omnitrophota bacterium]